jgi:hypothetical protein
MVEGTVVDAASLAGDELRTNPGRAAGWLEGWCAGGDDDGRPRRFPGFGFGGAEMDGGGDVEEATETDVETEEVRSAEVVEIRGEVMEDEEEEAAVDARDDIGP